MNFHRYLALEDNAHYLFRQAIKENADKEVIRGLRAEAERFKRLLSVLRSMGVLQ